MQTLATELKTQNRTLIQVRRQGRVALYELYGANGMLYGFEVILIKVAPARNVFGKDYPKREVYPSNEDWGSLAWSYGKEYRDLAEATFQELCVKGRNSLREDDFGASEGKDSGKSLQSPLEPSRCLSEDVSKDDAERGCSVGS